MGKGYLNFRVILLLFILILTYTIPMLKIILPTQFSFKKTYIVVLSLSSTLSMLYMILSMMYRGCVEYNIETVGLISHYHTRKFCRKCDNFKPERAHHCSACGRCIKKMDHHCFWINNCVNYDNQGHFIRFLFFSALANLLILSYTAARSVGIFFFDHSLKNREDYVILVVFGLISLVLFLMTASFFYLQMKLAFSNMTFIEQLKQEDLSKFEGVAPSISPYDRGLINNLKDALGSPYTLFLIGPFGDGIRFMKTYPANYWPNAHEYYNIEDTTVI